MPHASHRQLGLVGLGQFGRLAARALRSHFDVLAADQRDVRRDAVELGIRAATIAEVAQSDIVVLAVPVLALQPVLRQIAPALRPGALVVDVCSVKIAPLRWMRELLPAHVEILGTHPMFGPQSAGDALDGMRIAVCPERTDRIEAVQRFLEGLGLEVLITDADTHDRQCAHTQALTQYLGRAMGRIGSPDYRLTTPAARLMQAATRMVHSDSWELFEAIQTLNPYAAEVRAALRTHLDEIDIRLGATGKG